MEQRTSMLTVLASSGIHLISLQQNAHDRPSCCYRFTHTLLHEMIFTCTTFSRYYKKKRHHYLNNNTQKALKRAPPHPDQQLRAGDPSGKPGGIELNPYCSVKAKLALFYSFQNKNISAEQVLPQDCGIKAASCSFGTIPQL